MARLRVFLSLSLLVGVASCLLPMAGWRFSGRAAWLALVPLLWLALVLLLLQLGLWHSHGNLPAFLRGQVPPRRRQLQRDISVSGAQDTPFEVSVTVDRDRPLARASSRYLSFAIDTSQLVGGRWWNPDARRVEWGSGTVHAPLFDFDRSQLDRLVRALAPAYLRLGGSEADKVYYDLGAPADGPAEIPAGYHSVLTAAQWDAANAFAARNGLQVVCTLNAGPAARDEHGRWTGENAAQLLAFTARREFPVAVWELGNELNAFFAVHGLRSQVPVARYARDLALARRLLDLHTPGALLASQGSAFWPVLGEPLGLFFGYLPAMLEQAHGVLDLITWHYYPQQSRRGPMATRRAAPARLLEPRYLDEAAHWATQMVRWRDRHAPGLPLWLGETGNAQFGGEPGVSDVFVGGLWWLDQLGLLARLDQRVMVRQTLTGSDYGLIDDRTLEPRPDYWLSLLWKRLMGREVFGVRVSGHGSDRLRVYAHSAVPDGQSDPGLPGGVALLVLNLDLRRAATLSLPEFRGWRYELFSLTAPDIQGRTVLLNGSELALTAGGDLPHLGGIPQRASGVPRIEVGPLSCAFVLLRPAA